MKKIAILMMGALCFIVSNAQTSIAKEASKVIHLIERNVTTDGRKPSRLNEYYIYDINLDSNGKITHVDLLRLDSSFYVNDIKKVIPLIEKKWIPVKSSVVKVMIPVLIIDSDRADEETEHNKSVAEIATFFEEFLKGRNTPKVFVSGMAIVVAYSNTKRSD